MGRFVYDPQFRLLVPNRAERRWLKRSVCSLFAGPAFFSGAAAGGPTLASRVLAISCEGSGASFTDNSANALTVTASGSATQTTSQFKFGAKSCETNTSTSDYIGVAANSVFSLTTFTVSLWVRFAANPNIGSVFELGSFISGFSCRANQGSASDIQIYWNSASSQMNGTVFGGSGWPTATWHHVALTRDAANTLRVFVGGALIASQASVTQVLSSPAVRFGAVLAGGANAAQKWEDDIVIANTCWWTAAFTPPAVAWAD